MNDDSGTGRKPVRSMPSLMEVLQPRHFPAHPKRAAVTRTVRQPEVDKFGEFEASEAALLAGPRVAKRARSRTPQVVARRKELGLPSLPVARS